MKRLIVFILDLLVTTILFAAGNYFFLYHGLLNDVEERRAFVLATLITSILTTATWHSTFPHFLKWFKKKTGMK